MSRQNKKDQHAWGGFMRWYHENEKVFWVVLLCLICFTFAFPQFSEIMNRPGNVVAAEVFGTSVRQSELAQIGARVGIVELLLRPSFGTAQDYFNGLYSTLARSRDIKPLEFYVYLEEAKRLGISVSDEELAAERRRIWRNIKAHEAAEARVRLSTQPNDQRSGMEFWTYRSEELAKLEENNVFDREDWHQRIRQIGRQSPSAVESALRDVLTVAKLETFVRSTVTVSDKELFDSFLEDAEKRGLSWLAVSATDDLRDKVKAAIKDDDIKAQFELHRAEYRLDNAIRCQYLIVPRAHFVEKIRGEVTDGDIAAAYDADRQSYPRPVILPEAGAFELLSQAEMDVRNAELYFPLEEVKDKVRDKLIETRATSELMLFANQLATRLQPTDPAVRPATIAELVAEHPFLQAGKVPPTIAASAEKDFGDAYTRTVDSWFTTLLSSADLSDAQKKSLERSLDLPDQRGAVFYRDVEVIPVYEPVLDDVRDKVLQSLVNEKLAAILATAADKLSADVAAGKAKLADLATTEIEVDAAEGVKSTAKLGKLETSVDRVRKVELVKVKAADESKDAASVDAGLEDDLDAGGKVHESARSLVSAAFEGAKVGDAKVAKDEALGTAYVVVVDAIIKPDSADFAGSKESTRRRLLRERQDKVFQDWNRDLFLRAYPADAVAAHEAADAPDAGGAGI